MLVFPGEGGVSKVVQLALSYQPVTYLDLPELKVSKDRGTSTHFRLYFKCRWVFLPTSQMADDQQTIFRLAVLPSLGYTTPIVIPL